MNRLSTDLTQTNENQQTLAVIVTSLSENINMQMEADSADLIDRRMMQLFAVAHPTPTKADMKEKSALLTGKSPYEYLTKQINNEGIPEVDLKGTPMAEGVGRFRG